MHSPYSKGHFTLRNIIGTTGIANTWTRCYHKAAIYFLSSGNYGWKFPFLVCPPPGSSSTFPPLNGAFVGGSQHSKGILAGESTTTRLKCTAAPRTIHNFKLLQWSHRVGRAAGAELGSLWTTRSRNLHWVWSRWEERIPFLPTRWATAQAHTHTRVHTFALHKPTCLLEQVATHVMRNGMQIREKLLLMSKYLPLDFNLFFSSDALLGEWLRVSRERNKCDLNSSYLWQSD